jgi:hypothetical protein
MSNGNEIIISQQKCTVMSNFVFKFPPSLACYDKIKSMKTYSSTLSKHVTGLKEQKLGKTYSQILAVLPQTNKYHCTSKKSDFTTAPSTGTQGILHKNHLTGKVNSRV